MKISIIIPTINRTEKLLNLLKDLVKQFNNNFEIIIIDQSDKKNNSTYLNKSFIKYVYNPKIKNLSDAKNLGITYALGEYIGFLDDDIELSKNFIERLFFSLERLNTIALTGLEKEAYNKNLFIYYLKKLFYTGIFFDKRILYNKKKYKEYIVTNKLFGGCSFIKKEVFKEINFRENSPFFINEDTDFSLILKRKTNENFYIDTNLNYFHLSETKKFNEKNLDSNKLINKLTQNIITTKLLFKFHKKSIFDYCSLIWLLIGYLLVLIYISFKYRNIKFLRVSLSIFSKNV